MPTESPIHSVFFLPSTKMLIQYCTYRVYFAFDFLKSSSRYVFSHYHFNAIALFAILMPLYS